MTLVLENVAGAPWDAKVVAQRNKGKKKGEKSLSEWLEIAGYGVQWRLLDTKSYYLPQTRERGYLVAIDRRRLPDEGAVTERLQAMVNVIDMARRRASSPAIAFANKDYKADFISTAATSFVPDPKGNPQPPWPRCAQNHIKYRAALGLGDEHALTNWLPGGAHSLPNFFHIPDRPFTERVLDSIDIGHLRNVRRGIDDRYYRSVAHPASI